MVFSFLAATANCTVNGEPADCGAAAGVALVILLPLILLGILSFIGWLVMLIHAISKDVPNKAVWIIMMLLFNVAWIIYYFAVKRPFDRGEIKPTTTNPETPQQ